MSKHGNNRKQSKTMTGSQRQDHQERKRDERATRNAYRKQQKDESYLADDENFASFATQLQIVGLELRDIPGDGNCLFRSLGDQLDGHGRNHLKHRGETVRYILDHRGDFEPFVEDDVPFDKHIENLAKSGTYAGNDSIVAFARRHGLNVVIHQLNAPDWRISGNDRPGTRELHLAYHNGDHYSSIRKYGDKLQEPTKFKSSDPSKLAAAGKKAKSKGSDGFSTNGASSYDVTGAGGVASENMNIDEMVIQIMDATGCQDAGLVSDTLEDYYYDVESTIEFIMQMDQAESPSYDCAGASENGIWSSGGTGARIFGAVLDEGNTKKTQPNRTPGRGRGRGQRSVNSRVVKHQKKAEKKERQTERHKQKLSGIDTESPEPDDDALSTVSVPIGQMGALSI
ncbi:OTU domain-containing protein 3-like [Asterias rubens]|uniref:OTU domain-containing protein 3-like n=1 Tax=Asterias rubens TaxID=7604 RepID=UPI001454FB4A|nr:OTU domain-containing protein 3-like [Asterias rubens]XP_033642293.1 OTU domain-containing protein 3-like [Asterias rubens]